MTNLKTYLNVPFAEKDAAKALGAKWDAIHKKWYVPADKDIMLFAAWQADSSELSPAATKPAKPANKNASSANYTAVAAVTLPSSKNFIAYNGDEPPWD
jgi:hypothetical protein